jgi:predicted DsbA family dithiol-disulfide isomerase
MLVVDVVSDVVCPWCYIGKRKLETALQRLHEQEPELEVAVHWHPFQLNPDLPRDGMARRDYLTAKFGAARADQVYDRVTAAGAGVGIPFNFAGIERQPNTLDAHRLVAWAQSRGDAGPLMERLFRAYFIEGRLLGDADELVRLASECGHAEADVRSFLLSDEGREPVEAEDREAREVGISGVPCFIFNGKVAVSGAQDPQNLLQAIAQARSEA